MWEEEVSFRNRVPSRATEYLNQITDCLKLLKGLQINGLDTFNARSAPGNAQETTGLDKNGTVSDVINSNQWVPLVYITSR